MGTQKTVWDNPAEIIRHLQPDHPVMAFAPTVLQDRARQFLKGFPGLVTYAVKSNPDEAVIQNLVTAGIQGFDVASPFEVDLMHDAATGRNDAYIAKCATAPLDELKPLMVAIHLELAVQCQRFRVPSEKHR